MQPSSNPLLAEARIYPLGQYAAMTYEETVERIRAAALAKGTSQTEMAQVAGLPSQSAMSNVLKGKRKLSIEEARRLEDFFGIEPEPLVRWVPVIGLASAGAWREAVEVPRSEFPIPRRAAGNRAFAVEIVGDSMNMLLPEGGWAVI
ncbi:MAG TPA: helix-turn-helix domain-containing protein, partial [Sphingomicrobium sp.]